MDKRIFIFKSKAGKRIRLFIQNSIKRGLIYTSKLDLSDVYKEIDQIQNCISRMANNSFHIKSWHIGLISALAAFFISKETVNYMSLFVLTIIITIIMWYLDSYYLLLERKYRWKYQWVINNRLNKSNQEITNEFFLNLNPQEKNMWEVNKDSKEYKAAIESIDSINKSSLAQMFYHIKEVRLVMQSCTMIAEYFSIILISIIGIIFYMI